MSKDTEETLKSYLANADELAQRVVNVWGPYASVGRQNELPADFMDLFEKACRYRDAKDIADNRREFNSLTQRDEAREADTRLDFAKSYRDLDEAARLNAILDSKKAANS